MKIENKLPPGVLGLERRRYPRFYVDLPFTYYEMESPVRYNGRAVNASEGGLMIYLRENIKVGQHLRTKLSFLNDSKLDSIQMQTRVVWKDMIWDTGLGDHRCGVKFVDITQEGRSKLKNFLSTLPQ